jgi:spore maturation protein A
MLMSWIWAGMVLLSVAAAVFLGNGSELSGAVLEGAQSAVTLVIGMAGAICLWSGVGRVMERCGITGLLSELLSPALKRLFPDTRKDKVLARQLSANICANILGLGNAATPMGVLAAQRMAASGKPGIASDQLCRLVVLNTASIQLIPTSVAAVRLAAGSAAPFDILPAVWLTSLCSAGVGLMVAWGMGKLWPDA